MRDQPSPIPMQPIENAATQEKKRELTAEKVRKFLEERDFRMSLPTLGNEAGHRIERYYQPKTGISVLVEWFQSGGFEIYIAPTLSGLVADVFSAVDGMMKLIEGQPRP